MKLMILKIFSVLLFSTAIASVAVFADSPTTKGTSSTTAPDQTKPTKFYGSITAIDPANNTFAIGEQTFTVNSESKMTKEGKPATIADVTLGEVARGTYTKSSEGQLIVTKVNFGKRSGGTKGKKDKGKEPATLPAN